MYIYITITVGVLGDGQLTRKMMMMICLPPRDTSPRRTVRAQSPQRHTAAGTAAPTARDMGNTVPLRANPTQTAYAHPQRGGQARCERLGTWTLVRPQKELMRVLYPMVPPRNLRLTPWAL